MKTRILFLASLALVSTAFADTGESVHTHSGTAQLQATDGTAIHIGWQTDYDFNPATGIANGILNAMTINVASSTATAPSQAVVINLCTSLTQGRTSETHVCNLEEGSCTLTNPLLIRKEFEGGASGNTECTQQIAVVMQDGHWLVDPVSGQHNFNFTME